MRLAPWNRFRPSRKSILLTVPRRYSFVDRFCWLCFMFGGVVLSCLFLVALWSPAGKGLTSWLLCLSCFVTFPNVPWSTSELRARLAPWNWFKPSSKIFTDRSKAVLLLWIICVIYVLYLSCFCVCSLLPCGHLLGKGWPHDSCLWCLIVILSLFYVVSWVSCGTWLYWFMIFVVFLTLICSLQVWRFLVIFTFCQIWSFSQTFIREVYMYVLYVAMKKCSRWNMAVHFKIMQWEHIFVFVRQMHYKNA